MGDKPKNPHLLSGRRSRFETEGALEILARLAGGESLHQICVDDRLPAVTTVYEWLEDGRHPRFAEAFQKARRVQGHRWASEIVPISDGLPAEPSPAQVFKAQTQIRARQWAASRAVPELYGDRSPAAAGARAEIIINLPRKLEAGEAGRLIEHERLEGPAEE